jgi:hypothetical protein
MKPLSSQFNYAYRPRFGKSSEILVHCWVCKWHHCAVAEAQTQHGMVCTSPPNIPMNGVRQASYAVDGHVAPYSAHYHYHHLSCPRFGKSSEILVHCRAANDTIVQRLRLKPNMGWAYEAIIRPFYLHVCQDLGSLLKFCFTAGLQLTPLCSGWGSNSTWNDSHIPFLHIKGGWQASYAVDGHMAPS